MIKRFFSSLFLFACVIYTLPVVSAPQDAGIDYDIVYVRYPDPGEGKFVSIPQGEKPYRITSGADLMLLHPDGAETVLVDCTQCSVMDPFISYNARWVYYSLIEDGRNESASWIYKIDLTAGAPYTPIRLTYDNGFDSHLYAGNSSSDHFQSSAREIRDMAPIPLADGRIMFTSNRAGLTAFDPDTDAWVLGSVQQLYVMDDHDGSAQTPAASNMHRLETGSIHMVQHPFQLMDGRIIFSTWQDVANKFLYAMTSLFVINPDGTNLKQFTEPHDHHKNLEHFVTQLPNEDVVAGWYYPSFDYGFGGLLRLPIDPDGPDYLRGSIDQRQLYGSNFKFSFREFDRKGTVVLTPHTTQADVPAPNRSGKYSMPSATKNGDMLVAYSTGYVNHFDSACAPDRCESLKSGIYLFRNPAAEMIEDPAELVQIIDKPNFNEIWPRAVVSYADVYGQSSPDIYRGVAGAVEDGRLEEGEASAIVGTSSMFNSDPSNVRDIFQSSSSSREIHDGNWTIEGAEAGKWEMSDVYAVRLIATPPKPYTKPTNKYVDAAAWEEIKRYLNDTRLERVVAQYGSLHNERWEILGEFPFSHWAAKDGQGNPDTSWAAKIPAETPFLIQLLDKNGMTIRSELTWRALKAGEKRTDCGGCHAHSVDTLDFESTKAGKGTAIKGVPGVEDDDPRIQDGIWDLTSGSIPMLSAQGVAFVQGASVGVEFNRDVLPILNSNCVQCHSSGQSNGGLVLDGSYPDDAWAVLTKKAGYKLPQRSRYIRIPQARESLLVWAAYGKRLDGRENGSRSDDIDYPDAHPAVDLTDEEKRTIARWVDLGSPIDFPNKRGFGYTEDYQLPIVNVFRPERGFSVQSSDWKIGFSDAKSGVDWDSIKLSYYQVDSSGNPLSSKKDVAVDLSKISGNGVLTLSNPGLAKGAEYILEVEVFDFAGNKNIDQRRFTSSASYLPGNDNVFQCEVRLPDNTVLSCTPGQ